MARSMWNSKKRPKEFWVEAVACAVYLSNRNPTRNVKNPTPQVRSMEWEKAKCFNICVLLEVLHISKFPIKREVSSKKVKGSAPEAMEMKKWKY